MPVCLEIGKHSFKYHRGRWRKQKKLEILWLNWWTRCHVKCMRSGSRKCINLEGWKSKVWMIGTAEFRRGKNKPKKRNFWKKKLTMEMANELNCHVFKECINNPWWVLSRKKKTKNHHVRLTTSNAAALKAAANRYKSVTLNISMKWASVKKNRIIKTWHNKKQNI